MLVDTHCHLHDREFFSESQAEEFLKNAQKRGVHKIIVVGTSHQDSLVARDFAEAHNDVYWTYGSHPSEATKQLPSREQTGVSLSSQRDSLSSLHLSSQIAESLKDNCLVAVGEIGLDYHYEPYNREAQIKLFEQQLQLAQDMDLPVAFHIREAFDDFFAVMANFPKITGVVHSFSDNKKNLHKILESTDYYVGVNGMATYSTLPTPPLERILLETDAPFLAPVPHRGEQNQPAFVADVADWLAQKLDCSVTEVAKTTTANAEQLFHF